MYKKFILPCIVSLVIFNIFLAYAHNPLDVYCLDEQGHDCFVIEYYETCGEYPYVGYPYASDGRCILEDWKAAECCETYRELECVTAIFCPSQPDK